MNTLKIPSCVFFCESFLLIKAVESFVFLCQSAHYCPARAAVSREYRRATAATRRNFNQSQSLSADQVWKVGVGGHSTFGNGCAVSFSRNIGNTIIKGFCFRIHDLCGDVRLSRRPDGRDADVQDTAAIQRET